MLRNSESIYGQRTHRVAGAELHGRVDVAGRRITAFQQTGRLHHVRHQESVDDEAGRVLARDGRFSNRLAPLHHFAVGRKTHKNRQTRNFSFVCAIVFISAF